MFRTPSRWLIAVLMMAALGACTGGAEDGSNTSSTSSVISNPSSTSSVNSSFGGGVALDAANIYEQQCQTCHGDTQGRNDNGSGKLIKSQCVSCREDNPQILVDKIESTMPLTSPAMCGNDCAVALADYIFANFAGYAANLSGEQEYEAKCKSCHGDGETDVGLTGPQLVPGACNVCGSRDSLITRIDNTMPRTAPASCDRECAGKIADYMFDTFSAYQSIGSPGMARNLVAPSDFKQEERANNIRLTWSAPADQPDQWVIDRWSDVEKVWDSVAILNGSATAHTDTGKSFGRYRLYMVTEQIASVPAHALPPGIMAEVSGGVVDGRTDSLHMSYVPVSGDFTAEIKIDSIGGDNSAAAAGLVVREGSGAGAKQVGVFFSGIDGARLYQRAAVNGNNERKGRELVQAPVTLMLSRAGNRLTGSLRDMSGTVKAIDNVSMNIANDVIIGLAVAGGDASAAGPTVMIPGSIPADQCNNTTECRNLFGAAADDCSNSGSANSVCMCGSQRCDAAVSGGGSGGSSSTSKVTVQASAFKLNGNVIEPSDLMALDMGTTTEIESLAAITQADNSAVAVAPQVEAQPVVHISRFELEQMLKDLFPSVASTEFDLVPDDGSSGFEVGINTTDLSVEKFGVTAEDFSQVIAPSIEDIVGCNLNNEPCVRHYLNTQGQKLLRRPLSNSLAGILMGMYRELKSQYDAKQAVVSLHHMLAQSPSFLYKFEAAGAGMESGTTVPVTGYEMASRLSMALWASSPDDQLLQAAAANALNTPEQIKRHAERMIEDPKAKNGFINFYRQWLGVEALDDVEVDISGVTFNEGVADAMRAGLDAYVNEIVFSGRQTPSLANLFSASLVGNNSTLAPFTGINTTRDNIQVVATDGSSGNQRTGLLGQPAILTLLQPEEETALIYRGAFIFRKLMCQSFVVPDNVPAIDTIDPAGKTHRQIVDELTNRPGCWECHQYLNPVGAALSNFDIVGRYHTNEGGLPIDSRANILSRINGTQVASVDGLKELNDYLATDPSIRSCFAKQYLSYSSGMFPGDRERGSVDWLVDQMNREDWNIKKLMVEATQTPMFLYKKVQ